MIYCQNWEGPQQKAFQNPKQQQHSGQNHLHVHGLRKRIHGNRTGWDKIICLFLRSCSAPSDRSSELSQHPKILRWFLTFQNHRFPLWPLFHAPVLGRSSKLCYILQKRNRNLHWDSWKDLQLSTKYVSYKYHPPRYCRKYWTSQTSRFLMTSSPQPCFQHCNLGGHHGILAEG